mmetsp:Transcript_61877/g.182746  ORF Transcript_61877/g.182746 Transcript_61877/m.182746 type:complete len:221 (-) Transcript_61877:485-1147(-)
MSAIAWLAISAISALAADAEMGRAGPWSDDGGAAIACSRGVMARSVSSSPSLRRVVPSSSMATSKLRTREEMDRTFSESPNTLDGVKSLFTSSGGRRAPGTSTSQSAKLHRSSVDGIGTSSISAGVLFPSPNCDAAQYRTNSIKSSMPPPPSVPSPLSSAPSFQSSSDSGGQRSQHSGSRTMDARRAPSISCRSDHGRSRDDMVADEGDGKDALASSPPR